MRSILTLAVVLVVTTGSDAFAPIQGFPVTALRNHALLDVAVSRRRLAPSTPRMLFVETAKEEEVGEGERKVVKIRGLTVVVAKQEGKYYAFNNKCPHLGLSLKRGEITPSNDRHGVCITCPYHKSKFSLEEEGKCKVWSESFLGIKGTEGLGNAIGGFVAPMAKSVNPMKKKAAPAVTYATKVEDGAILVDLPPDLSKYGQTRIFKGYMDYDTFPKEEEAKEKSK